MNELTTQENNWELTQRQAQAFLASGYLREEFTKGVDPKTAIAKVLTIITCGDELGIGRMQALRSINVIKGKPALAAELMLGLCFKKIPGFKATFTTPFEKQHLECTVIMQRPGGDPSTFKFTLEEARNAGLVKPDSGWSKYPQDMLRARAISRGCRAIAPDATMGMVSMEETGHEVIEHEPVMESTQNRIDAPEKQTSHVKLPIPDVGATPIIDKRGFPHGEYPQANPNWRDEPCTEKQRHLLYALGSEMGFTHEHLKDTAFNWFQVEHLELLSKGQIQEMIEELKQEEKHDTGRTETGKSRARE